jgi:hypothetical protein
MTSLESTHLTTYEEERNARIASNQQLLESLGLHTEVAALKSAGKNEIINIPTVLPLFPLPALEHFLQLAPPLLLYGLH